MEEIKLFVERQTGCKATLQEDREATWKSEDGDKLTRYVYTFRLDGPATAKRAFVWQDEGTIGTRQPEYTMMLGLPPVISPEAALRERRAQFLRNL